MSYVASACNVYNAVAILSMTDMACLGTCRNFGVHEQCWVCMACWSLSWSLSFVVKFYCCWTWQIWIDGRLWSEQRWVPCSFSVYEKACREFCGVHSWQNGTRCRDGVKVLWCHSHLVWLVFEGSIPTCACFHSENFLWLIPAVFFCFLGMVREMRKKRIWKGAKGKMQDLQSMTTI